MLTNSSVYIYIHTSLQPYIIYVTHAFSVANIEHEDQFQQGEKIKVLYDVIINRIAMMVSVNETVL